MAYMSSRRREWHHGRTSHSQLSKQTAFVDPFLLLPLRDQDAIRISQDEGRPLPLTPSSVQLAGSEPRPQPATPPAFLFSSQQRGQVDIPCTQLKGGTTFGDTSPPSSLGWDQGINPATLSEVKTTRATPLFSLHKDQDLAVRSPSAIQVLGTFEEHRERCFFPASGIESCSTPHDGILAPQPSNLATLVPSVQHVASFQRGEPDAHHGSPLLGKDTGEEPRVNQTPNWDVVKDEYDALVWSYVEQCPINLFDTKRQRNICRSELKEDITTILERWFALPLSCSELEKTILDASLSHSWPKWTRDIRPFLVSALLKTPVIDATDHFISTLTEELLAYHARANLFYISYIFPGGVVPRDGSVATVLEAVRELIERKRAHPPMPSKQDVKDQIEILGQYAILSHRWEDEELSFTDVENFSDPLVQSKKGFQKLTAFSKTVEEHYGCRYLWMDTVCISEVARNRSIPLMFGWYRRAYVCVVYFTNPGRPEHPGRDGPRDPWFTRGWTLQEFLAAPRINVLTSNSSGDWHLHQSGASKFNACRDNPEIQMTNNIVDSVPKPFDWFHYEPGLESALPLFKVMIHRETKRPEDKVYCLLSALNVDIPIMYGEGLDHAFYRLQAHYLSQTYDRRCLLWPVKADCFLGIACCRVKDVKDTRPSPWNSMLAADFDAYSDSSIGQYGSIVHAESLPDPSISLDEGGVMRIMASLFPWKDLPYYPSQRDSRSKTPQEPDLVFASLHFLYYERYYGVLLRPIPPTRLRATVKNFQDHIDSDHVVYERVSLKVFPKSELPFHEFVKPEWIYIR